MPEIIFYVFLGVVAIQLIYYFGFYGTFAFAKPQQITPKNLPVSVVICAKNEAENLKKLIPILATQDYHDFEIVLIDDASSDETIDIVEEFQLQYRNLKLVKVENNEAFWANKKYSLTLGIKAATKEYLLFSDADCFPASQSWIKAMSGHFTDKKSIVLGYAAFEKKKNSLLNKIIRFDAMLKASAYFSRAISGRAHTANGRNLAYTKGEFFKNNGFVGHMNIRGGHDALFINQAATHANTAICYTPESFTVCPPKQTFKIWYTQKRRYANTFIHLRLTDRLLAKTQAFFTFLFFALTITLLIIQFNWIFVLAAVALRYISGYITISFTASKLKEKDTAYWYPLLEIFLIFTNMCVHISNLFSKPPHWK